MPSPSTHAPRASISSNLPSPPPADRVPTPKGRTHQFKLLRKGKDRERRHPTDLEDDWTIEGMSPDAVEDKAFLEDSEPALEPEPIVPEMPVREEAKKPSSKGRQLVKKTSRLFSRDKDREGDSSSFAPSSSSSLVASRQTSASSADSQTTGSASRTLPSAFIQRHSSMQSKSRSPRTSFGQPSHSRRASQDSQSSWQAPRSIRSFASNDTEPSAPRGLPIPQRQGASIPSLSRQSLLQPINVNSRSPETIPGRMSSWFSHLLPTAENQPASLGSSPGAEATSPIRKQPSVAASLFNAARQKAVDGVRHLLDSEAQPDKCMDTIWMRGVGHPGYRPKTPDTTSSPLPSVEGVQEEGRRSSLSMNRPSPTGLRPSSWRRNASISQGIPAQTNQSTPPNKGFTNLFNSSSLSLAMPMGSSPSKEKEGPDSPNKKKPGKEVLQWPEQFYDDFRGTVWCTYRNQYAPILALSPNLLIPSPEAYYASFAPPLDVASAPPAPPSPQQTPTQNSSFQAQQAPTGWWGKEERGLTSDAGWGCMLRTGQSLLVNAIVHIHLGRDWRAVRPPTPPTSAAEAEALEQYAKYIQIISWFLDDPSPLCPFSVHRMALIGKELGKEVGEWFGPSTAAGALKTLANSFAPCGVSVATATDSIIYKSDVYAASNLSSDAWDQLNPAFSIGRPNQTDRGNRSGPGQKWGHKAVLVLVGVRLGLDGVNPIYHDSIKTLFTFPQSVGIAGGRPSSSYYFIGTQANSLFYLDPHLTRPAVPLQVPPLPTLPTEEEVVVIPSPQRQPHTHSRSHSRSPYRSPSRSRSRPPGSPTKASPLQNSLDISPEVAKYKLDVVNVDDVSESDSEGEGQRVKSPKKEAIRRGFTSPTGTPSKNGVKAMNDDVGSPRKRTPSASPTKGSTNYSYPLSANSSQSASESSTPAREVPEMTARPKVDPHAEWYIQAYPEHLMRTYQCEKVKKLPISGLDPSMLLGFVVRDEKDFEDFIDRVNKLPKKIFTIQNEQPQWEEEDDVGLESVSEPELDSEDEFDAPGTAKPRFEAGSPIDSDMMSGPNVLAASELDMDKIPDIPSTTATPQVAREDYVGMSGSASASGSGTGPTASSSTSAPTTLDEDNGDGSLLDGSMETTVGAVDIAKHLQRVDIANSDGEEEDGELVGGTPSSGGVMVEPPSVHNTPNRVRPVADRQDTARPVSSSPEEIPRHVRKGAESGHEDEKEVDSKATSGTEMPPMRNRMESWVEPIRGGQEAPNGDSLL
ncbi:hypothetical protein I350_08114 [Cryptococcus amylolentus CBS 6273]|uniref:Autophagy-related protein 4 n=1 Tax=Cryptococcus amylolentus CBS 6273 TaxID=1296118 RepID=A0A1E3J8F5_9TREE|nr:hypothetical protein I350_08114 [Cryptococcus amylolentus CBS 6273]